MSMFLVVRPDGKQIVIGAEKITETAERVYDRMRENVNAKESQLYFDRQIQLSIWHYVDDIENMVNVWESIKGAKDDCQYIHDHYDDVHGVRFLNEPNGTCTTDMEIEFLTKDEVRQLMKEAA